MPEGPEVRIMSDFINSEIGHLSVKKVEKSPISKNKCDLSCLEGKEWKIKSSSRGKEMKIEFSSGDEHHIMKVNFAKIGSIEVTEIGNYDDLYDRRAMLRFYTEDKVFAISDFTRFIIWRWASEWDTNRSPDVVLEHNEWRDFLYKERKNKYFQRPIFEIIKDQRFFNGVGNFSRSEILGRTKFSPFTPFNDVLESDILREDFFTIIKEVMNDIYDLGGFQFKFWQNPYGKKGVGFNRWIKCHNKPRKAYFIKDAGGKFWFDKKWSIDYVKWVSSKDDQPLTLTKKIYSKIEKNKK